MGITNDKLLKEIGIITGKLESLTDIVKENGRKLEEVVKTVFNGHAEKIDTIYEVLPAIRDIKTWTESHGKNSKRSGFVKMLDDTLNVLQTHWKFELGIVLIIMLSLGILSVEDIKTWVLGVFG